MEFFLCTVRFCSTATGISLIAVIVILTVAFALSSLPSFTLNEKLSLVAEFDVLMYVTWSPSKLAVPLIGVSIIE